VPYTLWDTFARTKDANSISIEGFAELKPEQENHSISGPIHLLMRNIFSSV
jgi:hypothetical protein